MDSTPDSQLRITTLGGLRIQLGAQPVTGFVSRKVEALLVYLAAAPREHPRELLADLLWDDLPQHRALAYLRTALASLQKQLAPFVVVSRYAIGINPSSDYWLDASALEAALDSAEALRQRSGSLSRGAAAELDIALALYHGPFLQGFFVRDAREFEGWMILQQERLQSRVLEAHYRLGTYLAEHGQPDIGARHVERALELDPLWEEAHRGLMHLLAQAGQRSAALQQFEACKRILADELGVEPDAATVALYEKIATGAIAAAPRPVTPHNLPTPHTQYIGHPSVLEAVAAELVQPDCRLLTLTGPGGIGKTRLALEVARQALPDFADGVFFVSLALAQHPSALAAAIAHALNLEEQLSNSAESILVEHLRSRTCLLVLDNMEHLLDGAEMLSWLLAQAPGLKLIVTSRVRLNLLEEYLFTVEALPVPARPEAADAPNSPAVRLFAQIAQRLRPGFDVQAELAPVVRICQLLEGVPLAIELAASWVRMLTGEQIVDELARSFDFLSSSARNVPARHRSLRAVFDSSWNLLQPDEQGVFRQLAVFRGGFDAPAAQAVAGASLVALAPLVDQSLVRSSGGRYEMHELLRQYAAEMLAEDPGEKQALEDRHRAYYAAFLHARRGRLARSHPDSAYSAVMADYENIRAACTTALERGDEPDVDIFLTPLYRLYDIRSAYQAGARFFREVAARLGAQPAGPLSATQARSLLFQAACLEAVNEYADAAALAEAVLPVFDAADALWEMQLALRCLANIAYATSDYRAAQSYYERVRQILIALDEHSALAPTLFRLADLAAVLGDYQQAKAILEGDSTVLGKQNRMRYLLTLGDINLKLGQLAAAETSFGEALALSHELEARTSTAVALVSLGRVAHAQGNYRRAQQYCRDSIALCEELRNLWGQAFALLHLGRACAAQGDFAEAKQHYRAGLTLAQQINSRWIVAATLRHNSHAVLQLGDIASARDDIRRALELAIAINTTPLILDIIAGAAELAAWLGAWAEAAALAGYVAADAAIEFETQRAAARVLAGLPARDGEPGAAVVPPVHSLGAAIELVMALTAQRLVGDL